MSHDITITAFSSPLPDSRQPALIDFPDWNNQEILNSLLASAPIAIAMVDSTGSILYANTKLEELFGYDRRELMGQPIELLIPQRFRTDHVRHRSHYFQNPHVRSMGSGMDLAGRHKNGAEIPVEAGLSYIRVGDEMMVMASITDITRRKQTEELLEHRVEERTRELERRRQVSDGLRDILTVLNSNRSLVEILDHIAAQACRLLHANASAIYRIQGDQGPLILQASCGLPEDYTEQLVIPPGKIAAGQIADLNLAEAVVKTTAQPDAADRASPLVVHSDDRISILSFSGKTAHYENSSIPVKPGYQALLTVPLIIKDGTYGCLMLYYAEPRKFSAEEIELATSVGDQTALAIENARLRTQVERTAVAAERSRIARDLHDSVTQTLFSASLIAEVLPRLWQRDSDESERRLEELRQLTRGALAEMRTLLLELRPATLIEVNLGELLRQLTEAIMGRARVPITLEIHGDDELPPDVKIAYYHIAQEALNNVAKHARAGHASVILQHSQNRAHLSIEDDGRGFVIEKVTPEHLGLSIMNERAEAIGARLEIVSRLQHGTVVSVEWQKT